MTTESDILRGALIDWVCSLTVAFGGMFLVAVLT